MDRLHVWSRNIYKPVKLEFIISHKQTKRRKIRLGSLVTQNLLMNSSVFSGRLYKLQVLYTTVNENF